MNDQTPQTVHFEVWRTHLHGGPDVLIYGNLSEDAGPSTLDLCLRDKAEAYPDAPIDFYLVRATTTREVLS